MAQSKLKEEELNKSINASRDDHSLSYIEESAAPKDKLIKDQIGTVQNGDAGIAKLEAPIEEKKEDKEEILFTADTPMHKYMEQNSINRNQNKENHLSYTEDLSRRYGEDHQVVNQNMVIQTNAVRAEQADHRDRYYGDIDPNQNQINQNQAMQFVPAQNVYYSHPIPPQIGYRRRVFNWVIIILLVVFIATMVGIITWGILKYKKRIAAQKKNFMENPYGYVSVAPKIVDPISESQYEESLKNSREIIPINSVKAKTKNPHSKPIPIVSPSSIPKEVKPKVQVYNALSKPIVLPRGNEIACPWNQLLVNGNCLACKDGEEWVGLECVPVLNMRHMKRYL